VAEGGNPSIESQTFTQELLNVFHFDRVEVAVDRPLRNDDNSLSLSSFTVLEGRKSVYGVSVYRRAYTLDDLTHMVFPRVSLWRVFRNKYKIGSTTIWSG